MKIYVVTSRLKNAGYSPGDSCVSGEFYDIYKQNIVTASSKQKALNAMKILYPNATHVAKILEREA